MSLCGMPYEEVEDYSAIWKEKRVCTRKHHRCYECQVEIPVGESVGKADSLYDGQWLTMYRCAACLILAEWAATLWGECALWGGLSDFICNLRDEGPDLPSPTAHRKKWEALP